MAYEPTEWKSGDVVTSAKLNKMEQGIENATLPAVTSDDNGDVLTVVEGAWGKKRPSVIVYTTPEQITSKSYNDYIGLLQDGNVIFYQHWDVGEDEITPMAKILCLVSVRPETIDSEDYYVARFSAYYNEQPYEVAINAETATDPMSNWM